MVEIDDEQVECLKKLRGAWGELKLNEKRNLPVTIAATPASAQASWSKLQEAMDDLAGWDLIGPPENKS